MIDELPTRAAMTVAAVLLLATGLSLIRALGGDAVRDAAFDLAGHLARALDEVGRLPGGVRLEGGLGVPGAFGMPPALAGSPYRVEFRVTDVRVIAGAAVAVESLRVPVHPFPPDWASYTASDLDSRDRTPLALAAGAPFVVERAERTVDGTPALLTFVHLP